MEFIELSISGAFSKAPGPRYDKQGRYSGECFRRDYLAPAFESALKAGKGVSVNLDGTLGYSTSFLEEVFGGLARDFGANEVLSRVKIISSEEPYLVDDITEYINGVVKKDK